MTSGGPSTTMGNALRYPFYARDDREGNATIGASRACRRSGSARNASWP